MCDRYASTQHIARQHELRVVGGGSSTRVGHAQQSSPRAGTGTRTSSYFNFSPLPVPGPVSCQRRADTRTGQGHRESPKQQTRHPGAAPRPAFFFINGGRASAGATPARMWPGACMGACRVHSRRAHASHEWACLSLNPPWVGYKGGFLVVGLNLGFILGATLGGSNPGSNLGPVSSALAGPTAVRMPAARTVAALVLHCHCHCGTRSPASRNPEARGLGPGPIAPRLRCTHGTGHRNSIELFSATVACVSMAFYGALSWNNEPWRAGQRRTWIWA